MTLMNLTTRTAPLIVGLLSASLSGCAHGPQDRSAHDSCHGNLKAMQAAKTEWARENNKRNTDIPSDPDLFGSARFILQKPQCPAGGRYTLGKVSDQVTCSIPEHNR